MSAILEAEVPVAEIPEPTWLYHVYGEADLLLYIGVSNDFGRRWKEHAKQQPWWDEKRRMTTLLFDSRPEAEEAETAAIKAEHPKYNIIHNRLPARPEAVPRARRVAAEAADPTWIPVRIPKRENPPVHRYDRLMPRVRTLGMFTMAELRLSSVAGAEAMIAGLPEESREFARLKLEFWRMEYRICREAWQAMQDLYVLELTADKADVIAMAREGRALCRGILELPCPCCDGKPSAGMTCQECGESGPAHIAVFRATSGQRACLADSAGTAA